MEILYTARFIRSYKKLPPPLQEDVEKAVELFKNEENHEKLRLHTLHGRMKQYHAFSANFAYRIIVKLVKGSAYCMDVGDHSLYE